MTKNQFMALVYLILYSIIYPISFETTFNLLVSLALLVISVRKICNAIKEFEQNEKVEENK